jgi:hypothetical protein
MEEEKEKDESIESKKEKRTRDVLYEEAEKGLKKRIKNKESELKYYKNVSEYLERIKDEPEHLVKLVICLKNGFIDKNCSPFGNADENKRQLQVLKDSVTKATEDGDLEKAKHLQDFIDKYEKKFTK